MTWHNERVADEAQDLREFVRELLVRSEKTFNATLAGIDRNNAQMAEMTVSLRKHTERMERDHREFTAELRAQREATFRMLDRLGGNGGTAPAA